MEMSTPVPRFTSSALVSDGSRGRDQTMWAIWRWTLQFSALSSGYAGTTAAYSWLVEKSLFSSSWLWTFTLFSVQNLCFSYPARPPSLYPLKISPPKRGKASETELLCCAVLGVPKNQIWGDKEVVNCDTIEEAIANLPGIDPSFE